MKGQTISKEKFLWRFGFNDFEDKERFWGIKVCSIWWIKNFINVIKIRLWRINLFIYLKGELYEKRKNI